MSKSFMKAAHLVKDPQLVLESTKIQRAPKKHEREKQGKTKTTKTTTLYRDSNGG